MSFLYSAYGLSIESDIELLSLMRAEAIATPPDIRIRVTREADWASSDRERQRFEYADRIARYHWPPVGSFEVRDRRDVLVAPTKGASDAQLSLPILGPIMARLLHWQGLLTLHGSTLQSPTRAVIFLGDKGAGKSTMAASLLAADYDLINDDLVCIDMTSPEEPTIRKGYPHFRVLPDTLAKIDLSRFPDFPSPAPWFPKVIKAVPSKSQHPFAGIVTVLILKRGHRAAHRKLVGAAALPQLMRFSQMALFTGYGWELNNDDQARHFAQCAALSRTWPVLELEVPDGLEHLSKAIDLIVRDFL